MPISISIVVPFYNGNKYLKRLIASIEKVVNETKQLASYEVILVNDSPKTEIVLPQTRLSIRILSNTENLGIQGSRVNGYYHSHGEWLLFLDQDDELCLEGFKRQIILTDGADVVVGNGIYCLGNVNKKIFKSRKSMEYLIQRDRFLQIRNLIPSPGECLIRKEKIPKIWIENKLTINGADDWFLWLLLFAYEGKFVCNEASVYIHNDSGGENLSADLNKMRRSALEMAYILFQKKIISAKEYSMLHNAIDFKYFQDTSQLSIFKLVKYYRPFIANVKYRLRLNSYKEEKPK